MLCPYCKSADDKVIESRQNSAGTSVRRRRECLSCKGRFTSYEQIEEKKLMVIKKDNSREPFDQAKVARGIKKSLEKRAVSVKQTDELLQSIEDEAEMIGKNSREITTGEVGDLVLKHLFKLDKVAYVRFASVYRAYSDVNEFISEIERFTDK